LFIGEGDGHALGVEGVFTHGAVGLGDDRANDAPAVDAPLGALADLAGAVDVGDAGGNGGRGNKSSPYSPVPSPHAHRVASIRTRSSLIASGQRLTSSCNGNTDAQASGSFARTHELEHGRSP
jgi:hypothetical protein